MSSTENIQDPVTYANANDSDSDPFAVDDNGAASSSSSSAAVPSMSIDDAYRSIYPSNSYVFSRAASDGRSRKQKRDDFANLLRSNVPGFSGADDAQVRAALAMAAANVNKPQRTINKARRNAMKNAGLIAPPNTQLVQARQRLATALKDNTIRDPNLERFLGDVNVRGAAYNPQLEIYSRLRDEAGNRLFPNSWKTATPQQLPAAERQRAAKLFAEMNGMLGWQPKYDRRFLTTASAAQALGDPDMQKYKYELYDMDDNLYTPGTLIVSDEDGNIVSVGGYVMGDATPQQTHSYLKDMLYYGKHPTVNSRRMQPKGQYLQSVGINKKNLSKGMAPVKIFIEQALTGAFKAQLPWKEIQDGKVVERPALIGLGIGDKVEAVYTLSSVAYNTLLSRVAQLYMNLFLFPNIKNSFDAAGLGALKGAFMPAPITFAPPPNSTGHVVNVAAQVYDTWWTSYTDERIVSFVLRDPFINDAINKHIRSFTSNPVALSNVQKAIQYMINVVMMCMMRTHITSTIRGEYDVQKRHGMMKNFQAKNPTFAFGATSLLPQGAPIVAPTYAALEGLIAQGTPTMAATPIAWKTVKEMFAVVERGTEITTGPAALTRDKLYQNFLPTQ